MTSPRRVLVTGARAPVALDLARAFARAGFEPHLADAVSPAGARLSRLSLGGRIHLLPPPRRRFEAFGRAMADLVARLDPVMVTPTCEEVFYLAAAAKAHGFADRLFSPSFPVLRRLHSKVEFPALARSVGASAPDTWRATSRRDLDAIPLSRPERVLKPEFSRFGAAVRIGATDREIDRLGLSAATPWAAQKFVAGQEWCLWTAAVSGTIRAVALYRPAWRLGRSAAFGFEAAARDLAVEAAQSVAAPIASGLGLTGHLSFDLIRDGEGRFHAIECNPRATSGLHLFGADPMLASALLAGPAGEPVLLPPAGAFACLLPAMVLIGLPQALAHGRVNGWLTDLARGGDVLSREGDLGALVGALLDAFRFAAVGLTRRRSAQGQSTDDIEWNGESIGRAP